MARKFSTGEKVAMTALAALAGYGAYRYWNKNADATAGYESGEVDGDANGTDYTEVVSTTSARAARERSRVAREEARQARFAAQTQRRREAQARAAAERAAREAVAQEQRADTAERAARHQEALAAYDTTRQNIYA